MDSGSYQGGVIPMSEKSYVGISLEYDGDPHKFWEILKEMKNEAEIFGVTFECGTITTIKEE